MHLLLFNITLQNGDMKFPRQPCVETPAALPHSPLGIIVLLNG